MIVNVNFDQLPIIVRTSRIMEGESSISMDDVAVQPAGTAEVALGVTIADLGARELRITSGDDRRCWSWVVDRTAL